MSYKLNGRSGTKIWSPGGTANNKSTSQHHHPSCKGKYKPCIVDVRGEMINGKTNLASLMPGENDRHVWHGLHKLWKRKEKNKNNNQYLQCVENKKVGKSNTTNQQQHVCTAFRCKMLQQTFFKLHRNQVAACSK